MNSGFNTSYLLQYCFSIHIQYCRFYLIININSNTPAAPPVPEMAEEQMQQHNHQLQQQALLAGRAESTTGGDAAAKKFYNTFRALRGKETTFDQMLASEIESDNLEMETLKLELQCKIGSASYSGFGRSEYGKICARAMPICNGCTGTTGLSIEIICN